MAPGLRNFTGATGMQTIDLRQVNKFNEHQVQIQVSAAPATGTLAVAVKSPGASVYATLESSIDLTALSATEGKIIQFSGLAETFKFTPSNLSAGVTYSAYLGSYRK